MRAAVFEQFGGDIEVRMVDDPTPPPDGVVIAVRANGICRSDWHGWVGHDQSIELPHVPGHEMAGEVVAVGDDVVRVRVGDRVTAPFVLGCGRCDVCDAGHEHICPNQFQFGFTGWGSFAEYVALPYADRNVVRLLDGISYETAAGLGCRFATAFRAVVDQAGVAEGTKVAVWGCGGVGLSAVMIASALDAEVIALDLSEDALALASEFGASHTVLVDSDASAVAAVRDLTSGGADVSIDALGSTATAVSSIRSLRPQGRHVQIGLMIGDDVRPEIPMWRLHAYEIELTGSHGMQAWRYPAMLAMIQDGSVDPSRLVTKTLDLDDGVAHLTAMDQYPGTGFVVINEFSAKN